MRHIQIFSLLLALMLSQGIYANQTDFNPIESFERGKPKSPFAGKNIVLRIYNDWQNDPKTYYKLVVNYDSFIKDDKIIEKNINQIRDSAVIAFVEYDQVDGDVAEEISGSILAKRYDVFKEQFHDSTLFSKGVGVKQKVFFEDALGDSMPSTEVDIYIQDSTDKGFKIFITKAQTNDGILEVPQIEGSFGCYRFIISHLDYGIAMVEYHMIQEGHLTTPLVNRKSAAYERSIRGKVVSPDGKTVSGAVIKCRSVQTLGRGLINAIMPCEFCSITNEKGNFCFYMPNEQNPVERGYLIPPKSSYQTRIETPEEYGYVPYIEPIENDQEQLIVLEEGICISSFIFENTNGPITDPGTLRKIGIIIDRPDKKRRLLMYDDYKNGGVFPWGEYKAEVRGSGGYKFKTLMVNKNSPEELVFTLPEMILYSGRVVHGITGKPMSGAYVVGGGRVGKNNLSLITPEQWQALHDLPLEPNLDNPAIKPIREIYSIKKIIRTDELGNFKMKLVPEENNSFIAFEEDYLGIEYRKHLFVSDDNRVNEVPLMKLYPAAAVLVEVNTEQEDIGFNPKWIIDVEKNPAWVREFLAADNISSCFTYDRRMERNQIQSVHIPAGVDLKVRIDAPSNMQWCPIEIPEIINLEQGQVVDLGNFTFEPAMEVYVHVVNSQGEPVEGVPVKIFGYNGVWSFPHISDELGISMFYVVPDSSARFRVLCSEANEAGLSEELLCNVKGWEDTGRTFTMQLSDEILSKLFE